MASTFRRNQSQESRSGAAAAAEEDDWGMADRSSPPSHAGGGTTTSNRRRWPPPGCRAGPAGTALASTGWRELDRQLAAGTGGQPLGTCLHVEEDRCLVGGAGGTNLASNLVRYWCAEALSQEQSLLIPVAAPPCAACRTSGEDWSSPPPWWGGGHSQHCSVHSISDDDGALSSLSAVATTEKDVAALLHSLPRNLHRDRQQQQQQQQNAAGGNSANRPLDSLAEEGDGDEEEAEEEGLVVAWQYRKEIQQERLGLSKSSSSRSSSSSSRSSSSSSSSSENRTSKSAGGTVYCHSYDLQGRLADQINVEQATTIVPIGCCCRCCSACGLSKRHSRQSCGLRYYNQLMERVETMTKEHPCRVIRVLLYHPEPTCLAVALPLFLHRVCEAKLPVVVLATVQPWTASWSRQQQLALRHLQRTADAVLEVESFAGRHRRAFPPPSEFRHLHGLLRIRKATTCTLAHSAGHFGHLTAQKRPAAALLGLKRDRRKLHLQLLHIPPEEYAADGAGSVKSGAVRSGAGRPARPAASGCGSSSSGGGGGGALDF